MNNIFIATPSYDGKVDSNFLFSMLEYNNCNSFKFYIRTLCGDSLVTRARNELITLFYDTYKIEGYTHLLWQDSDVYLSGKGLMSMLDRNVDVVAAPVPIKNYSDMTYGIPMSVIGVYEEIEIMFYKARLAATGAFLMSTNAVEKIIEDCEKNQDFYFEGERKVYDVFKVGRNKENRYYSEDWYLCKKLKNIGFDLYIDSNTSVYHSASPTINYSREIMPLSINGINKYGKNDRALPPDLQKIMWITNDSELSKEDIEKF